MTPEEYRRFNWRLTEIPSSLTPRERLELAVLDCAFHICKCHRDRDQLTRCLKDRKHDRALRITPWRVWWYLAFKDKIRYLLSRQSITDAIKWCCGIGYIEFRPDIHANCGRITYDGLHARDLYRPWGGRKWLVSPDLGQRCSGPWP